MNRVAYYAWVLLWETTPVNFHNSRLMLWLLERAGAYAFKESE